MGARVEVTRLPLKVDVGDEEQRRDEALEVSAQVEREEERHGRDRGGHEHREEGRKQAPDAAFVELGEAEVTALERADQDARDEEPRDDEEDVHAHVPAAETREPEVEENDGQHRQGAQSIDVGTVVHGRASHSRPVPMRGCP